MISLGGLEIEIFRLSKEKKWITTSSDEVFPLAVASKEGEKPQLILFSTFDVGKDQLNQALRESGYGRVIKITKVIKIDRIPTTGTGKIQYSSLDEIV